MSMVHQFLFFLGETVVVVLLLLGLFRLRRALGLFPLYVTLGVFQPVQVFLAASVYVEFAPGFVITPGSTVMFAASLFAILLVYIREDALEARRVIYGILTANVTMTLLLVVFGMQLTLPGTLNLLGLSPTLFNQGARVMVSGTLALLGDVFLIIFVYEALQRVLPRIPFLWIYLTLALILTFDTLVFATLAFYGAPTYRTIVLSGIAGKAGIALLYAGALTVYLRFIDPVRRPKSVRQPYRDVFYALTYRGRYAAERARAEAAERERREHIRAVFDAVNDAILVYDVAEGRLLDVNPRGCELFGYERDELLAMDPNRLGEGDPCFTDWVARARRETLPLFEWHCRTKSGRRFWAEVNMRAASMGGAEQVLVVVRDITARRAAARIREANERLQELDRMKSVFFASMSHELRTPLNVIIGFTGILLMGLTGELNDEQKKQLRMVKNSSEHLLAMINDILDISKIESGRVELNLDRFDFKALLDEVIEAFAIEADRKGVALRVAACPSVMLVSDRVRVKQILFNLVSNAIKYTPQGEVVVSATLPEADRLAFAVADTGIGIDEKNLGRLFQPFQQVELDLTKHIEGTGLGLYLCKKIVTLLGGDITVESRPGHGSTFSVHLPLRCPQPLSTANAS